MATAESLVATAHVRPLRVAYLVDQHTATLDEVAQCIRNAISRWGGAYHGIFPMDGSAIPGEWWDLLRLLDPDVVYSLRALDATAYLACPRHCGPNVTPVARRAF